MDFTQEIAQLKVIMAEHFATDNDGCHDIHHTMRVYNNSLELLELLPEANSIVVQVAALLHDIARVGENLEKPSCHAKRGAKQAVKLLASRGWSPEYIEKIRVAVRCHRSRSKHAPEDLESKIIYDADKLDSLGAVGIGRAFLFAGRQGAKVHNSYEEAINSQEYSVDDTAYREYLVKLQHLPKMMFTDAGRKLAQERHEFMVKFFEQLNKEALY